ncbi:hypothetical protein PVK06_001436 [Gossypium arboreum]|uniref:Uncharacterized protein n=1 Tax=Gossypium arboreum TaxID=29729 RepID=A0ABR0R201_GOSAR|nr:hypothetical protein PVK06_001436 [Gossypium arboreum]
MVATTIFTSFIGHPLYILIGDKVEPWANVCGTTGAIQNILLLLNQRSKVKFEWMTYVDLTIIQYIPLEYLTNRSIWDVNVSLVVYTTMEMHESDRVM